MVLLSAMWSHGLLGPRAFAYWGSLWRAPAGEAGGGEWKRQASWGSKGDSLRHFPGSLQGRICAGDLRGKGSAEFLLCGYHSEVESGRWQPVNLAKPLD